MKMTNVKYSEEAKTGLPYDVVQETTKASDLFTTANGARVGYSEYNTHVSLTIMDYNFTKYGLQQLINWLIEKERKLL